MARTWHAVAALVERVRVAGDEELTQLLVERLGEVGAEAGDWSRTDVCAAAGGTYRCGGTPPPTCPIEPVSAG